MRGTIFVELLKMLEEKQGLDMVDQIIDACSDSLSTEGAYTSVGNYPHSELITLMSAIAERIPDNAATLLDEFAEFLILAFKKLHPEFFQASSNLLDFLVSVETHIHQEVLKLYPDAKPPTVDATPIKDNLIELHYQSHRPLAPFAVSLAKASAGLFETPIEVIPVSQSADQRDAIFRIAIQ